MEGETRSVEGVLMDLPTPIIPNIGGEPKREGLIDTHGLVSRNTASVALNLKGGGHGHLALNMTAKNYNTQTGFVFVPPHNPVDYPQSMGNAQEKALGTENSRQTQALFRKYIAVDGASKK